MISPGLFCLFVFASNTCRQWRKQFSPEWTSGLPVVTMQKQTMQINTARFVIKDIRKRNLLKKLINYKVARKCILQGCHALFHILLVYHYTVRYHKVIFSMIMVSGYRNTVTVTLLVTVCGGEGFKLGLQIVIHFSQNIFWLHFLPEME